MNLESKNKQQTRRVPELFIFIKNVKRTAEHVSFQNIRNNPEEESRPGGENRNADPKEGRRLNKQNIWNQRIDRNPPSNLEPNLHGNFINPRINLCKMLKTEETEGRQKHCVL